MNVSSLSFSMSSIQNYYLNGGTPKEITNECFRRMDSVNDEGIFISLISQENIDSQIKQIEGQKNLPLWGIPFIIKDNIDAQGEFTTAGCKAFKFKAVLDAHCVKLLKQAGAILIGKTNLDQFATGLVGVRSDYTPPKNAIDPEIIPGGSSSGSAVAIAHYLATFSLGTDTAGSGRIPAALNNIVGLKPSLGMISTTGVLPACRSLDVVSIFALNVKDAYTVLEVCTDYDVADPYANKRFAKPWNTQTQNAPLTITIPNAQSLLFCGDKIQEMSFYDGIDKLKKLGHIIVEVDFSLFYCVAKLLYEGAWVAERYVVIEELLNNNPDAIYPVTKSIIEKATNFTAADGFKNQYALQTLKKQIAPILEKTDLLCVPSMPTFFSVQDLNDDPIQPNSLLGTYTNFVNLLDLCGMAFPTGKRIDERPASLTLLAKQGEDLVVAKTCEAFMNKYSLPTGVLPYKNTQAPLEELIFNDEYLICVCGAHMSGLGLNHQLTDLNARFIRNDKTTDQYQLFQLTQEPPLRPGILKCQNGQSIEVEIWAMPIENAGQFIKQIPSPLGIGSIDLIDGQSVQGFLCESVSTENLKPITQFSSWRTFLENL